MSAHARAPARPIAPAANRAFAAAALQQRQVLLARLGSASASSRCRATTPSASPSPPAPAAASDGGAPPHQNKPRLLYAGIAFDMDGTLQEGNIPFADMRRRTEIPVGDLFTVLESVGSESSTDEDDEGGEGGGAAAAAAKAAAAAAARVRRAMDTILEIEAEAAASAAPMQGLGDLLRLLEARDVRVALVTRNTPRAAQHFFDAILAAAGARDAAEAARWRALFDPVITRHDRFVKPDRRLLADVAERWGVAEMGRVLMVGDSLEDVEIGNACGAATCLVAGGGNEVVAAAGGAGAAPPPPPPGAVPTFAVASLLELRDLLLESAPAAAAAAAAAGGDGDDHNNNGTAARLGWALGSPAAIAQAAASADPASPGAPAAGLPFVDWCASEGAFRAASVSFPRIGAAAGGLAACDAAGSEPDRVLHVGCAEGALTKLLASSGVLCVGADSDVAAAARRGLAVAALARGARGDARALAAGDLGPAARERGPFDAVLLLPPGGPLEALAAEAAAEAAAALKAGGALACEVSRGGCCVEGLEADVRTALDEAGLEVVTIGRAAGSGTGGGDVVLRVLARKP
jgi:phosphoglycolate phosphatase-like HAD superfamily hydrolase